MRTSAKSATVVVLAQALVLSCSSAMPAGFWSSYRKDLIVNLNSDQGPWGGWRWVEWRAEQAQTFREADVRLFAEKKGWKCSEREEYSTAQLTHWQYGHRPIFPLLYPTDRGFDYFSGVARFPRTIASDSIVLKCQTGWMRSNPTGHDPELVTAYGFIHLSKDGREMAVYHLWGE
jgi:hypothetical protein